MVYLPSFAHQECSALTARAIRGSVEIVRLLIDSGVDVEARYECMPVAGHLLMALNKNSQYKVGRLRVLSLLLEGGINIYATCNSNPDHSTDFRRSLDEDAPSAWSLCDEALLSSESEVVDLFQPYLRNGHQSQISISGIILATKEGVQVLLDYLRKACRSGEEPEQRRIKLTSLIWCVKKGSVEAIFSMVQAGFDIKGLWTHNKQSYRPFLDSILHSDPPLSRASLDLASFILDNYPGYRIEHDLIHSCLTSNCNDLWRLLFNNMHNSTGSLSGVVIMSLAARLNNFGAVSMLNQAPYNVDFNAKESYWTDRCSVLFLSSATFWEPFSLDTTFALLGGSQPASTKMLEFLVQRGADVTTCHPSTWSRRHWVAKKQLKWLLQNGLPVDTIPIFSVMAPHMLGDFEDCTCLHPQGFCEQHDVQRKIV